LTEFAVMMANNVGHRGPDESGVWVCDKDGVAFSHRRLSIIDVSPTGSQPMQSESGRFVVTFNGEIYNYLDIREQLLSLGHQFRGTSDTEVMLTAFDEWGVEKTLDRLEAMMALAVFDKEQRKLWLVRDRMGEKPLCYGWIGSDFVFGSTFAALRGHPDWEGRIDVDSLAQYFRLQYVPAPRTIFHGFKKLQAGQLLEIPLDSLEAGELPDTRSYWSLRDVAEAGLNNLLDLDDTEAIEELDRLLRRAVKSQTVADVPVGAFLSGGVDSSTTVALMQATSTAQVKTFSIGFEEEGYNEAPFAKAVAEHLGTDHSELYVSAAKAAEAIPLMAKVYDEPFADPSQIPTYLVSKLAREKVTVSLSGDGGDELFCGYNRHAELRNIWERTKSFPRSLVQFAGAGLDRLPPSAVNGVVRPWIKSSTPAKVQKATRVLQSHTPLEAYASLAEIWGSDVLPVKAAPRDLTLPLNMDAWPNWSNYLDTIMYVEAASSLPDRMLTKVDRASMAVSLESRVPLLDKHVVEFSWRLPQCFKLRDGVGKWILRQVLYKYVPSRLIDRPKAGFETPIEEWIRGPLREWADELLSPESLASSGLLDEAAISNYWGQHKSGKRIRHTEIWTVLMYQSWLRADGTRRLVTPPNCVSLASPAGVA
jgi:asparagine synthase (glutamine-hydrolysing)